MGRGGGEQNALRHRIALRSTRVESHMLPPVRCFTCGKPISAIWFSMQDSDVAAGSGQDIMLRHTSRYCCRMLLMTTDNLCALLSNANFVTPSECYMMDMTTKIAHDRHATSD